MILSTKIVSLGVILVVVVAAVVAAIVAAVVINQNANKKQSGLGAVARYLKPKLTTF